MRILRLHCEWRLNATYVDARRAASEALESTGFAIERVEGNIINARRGTPAAPRMGRSARTAIRARVVVVDFKSYLTVALELAESENIVYDLKNIAERYEREFAEIVDLLGATLTTLDPGASLHKQPEIAHSEDVTSVTSQLTRALQDRATSIVGRASSTGTPDGMHFVSGEDHAIVPWAEVNSLITVAGMAMTDPEIPAPTLERVHELHARFGEAAVSVGAGNQVMPLSPRDRKIIEFLFQQAAARRALPVRELYVCRDCGQKKIVNPDYQNAQRRSRTQNRLVGSLAGAAATLATGGVGLIGLAGRLLDRHQNEFVCTQCQGNRADVSLVTICPKCQNIAAEPVLRTCRNPGCAYLFASAETPTLLWETDEERGVEPPTPTSGQTDEAVKDVSSGMWQRTTEVVAEGGKKYAQSLNSGLGKARGYWKTRKKKGADSSVDDKGETI